MWHFNDMKFRTKVVLLGVISVLVTAFTIILILQWQITVYNQDAQSKVDAVTETNLYNLIEGIYNLVEAQDESTQQQVNASLNVARRVLYDSGGAGLFKETDHWVATNQLTQQTVELDLPMISIGGSWIGHNTDPDVETPLVDEITALVGGKATLFQRMNLAGDMLRVATNVQNREGQRAVGTFIPAVNPDGSQNAVIATVLEGETYRGIAYVVDAWYIAAYEPIRDTSGTVIGMLFVGVKQENIQALRAALKEARVGKTGRVYVLNGMGEARGRYVISPDGSQDGENAWELRDAGGGTPIQEIIAKALPLQTGEIAEVRYLWQEPGAPAPRWKLNQVTYFAPWDWVVVTEVYEDELLEYRQALETGRTQVALVTAVAGLAIAAVVGLVCALVARSLTRPLGHLASTAGKIAEGDLSLSANVHGKDEIGMLSQAFNEMTAQLREMIRGEQAQRQRLEVTVQAYVDHMTRVAQGDLLARVEVDGHGSRETDALVVLGIQLNEMTASLQTTIQQIRDAANDLSSAASEILAVSTQQASSANQQSAAIAQTTVTVDEVRAIAGQASARAQEVLEASHRTVAVSQVGQQAVQDTIDGMGKLKDRVESIAMNIEDLSQRARQVSQIINTVNEIAEQSNMLALNAAVEAARAGEAGKGFAVVAAEVRSLANQSRKATEQVHAILTSIQKAIQAAAFTTGEGAEGAENGVRLAAQAGESIQQLTGAIHESAGVATQVAAGGRQQQAGVEQIVQAMHQIHQAATQSLASIRQAEKSARHLDELAHKLTGAVGLYKI